MVNKKSLRKWRALYGRKAKMLSPFLLTVCSVRFWNDSFLKLLIFGIAASPPKRKPHINRLCLWKWETKETLNMVRHLALMNIIHVLMLFLYYKAAIDIVGIPDKILGLEIVNSESLWTHCILSSQECGRVSILKAQSYSLELWIQ